MGKRNAVLGPSAALTLLLLFPSIYVSPNVIGEEPESGAQLLEFEAENKGRSFDIHAFFPKAGDLDNQSWFIHLADNGRTGSDYTWLTKSLAEQGHIAMSFNWENPNSARPAQRMVQDVTAIRKEFAQRIGVSEPAEAWVISGHGIGSGQAAAALNSWSTHEVEDQAPMGYVALGYADDDSMDPSVLIEDGIGRLGLYLTGTADEVAPITEDLKDHKDASTIGYHIAEVIGANHLQYLNSDTIFDRAFDGTPTLTREQQQIHALERISPYISLICEHVPTEWENATARNDPWDKVSSDANAYVTEYLDPVRLASFQGIQHSPELSASDQFEINGSLRHLNGNIPMQVETELTWVGNGTTHSIKGKEGLSPDMFILETSAVDFPPGQHALVLKARVDGLPTIEKVTINRTDEVAVPRTNIVRNLAQNQSLLLSPYDLVDDPDHQPLQVKSATSTDENSSEIEMSEDGNSLRIRHVGSEIWTGIISIEVQVSEAPSNRIINVEMKINITERDAPVYLNQEPPGLIELIEDGARYDLDLADYVSDPENRPLSIEIISYPTGLEAAIYGTKVSLEPTPNWNGNSSIVISASDGVTAALVISISIQVEPVDDRPVLIGNPTFELLELGSSSWDISGFIEDPDGDILNLSLIQGNSSINATLNGTNLTIISLTRTSGPVKGWAIIARGANLSLEVPLEISITAINDPPVLHSATGRPTPVGLRFDVSFTDLDGPSPWSIEILNGSIILQSVTLACAEPTENGSLVCLAEVSGVPAVEVDAIRLRDADGNASEKMMINIEDEGTASSTISSATNPLITERAMMGAGLIALLATAALITLLRRDAEEGL